MPPPLSHRERQAGPADGLRHELFRLRCAAKDLLSAGDSADYELLEINRIRVLIEEPQRVSERGTVYPALWTRR